MRKIDFTMILIFILSLVALVTTSLYAWFSLVEKTQPIVIYSGSVDLYAELRHGNDKIETKLEIEGFIPGDTYSFNLYLENRGTLNTLVSVMFNFSETNNDLIKYISVLIDNEEKDLSNAGFVSFLEIGELGLTPAENKESGPYTNETFSFEIRIKEGLLYSELGHNIILNNITVTIDQDVRG